MARTLAGILACAVMLWGQGGASPESERERDVYRIYSVLLTNPQTSHGPDNNPRYVISEMTVPGLPAEPCVRPPKEREGQFSEVLADFAARKATPRKLAREFSISKPYELLSKDQITLFQRSHSMPPRPGDQKPPAIFDGVSDLFSFSDVYFSRDGRLALTQIQTWCGGLCGLFLWKVLEKTAAGDWRQLPWTSCSGIA